MSSSDTPQDSYITSFADDTKGRLTHRPFSIRLEAPSHGGHDAMAEPTIISWNPANWITVVLMVSLAFFIVGAITKIYQQKQTTV